MKLLFALALGLLPLGQACACGNELAGTWRSDKDMSMAFARENSRIQPKTEAFLDALFGHMTLTFSSSELHIAMPDIEVPVSGQIRPFAGFDERKSYKVLLCNDSMVVWSARRPFDQDIDATTFNFVDRDTVWVYAGSTVPGMPDLHVREYFQRVR
ncbi:hypothetical protein [Marilutibacter spongiae]|nr:hypothetical protein [Lysobacter spongiae]